MQPAPRNEGENVPEAFRRWAALRGYDAAVALSEKRDAFGREKYGQPLMSDDGRDTMQDAVEEIGDPARKRSGARKRDLMHYLFKAKMQGKDLSKEVELKKHLDVLIVLCYA